MQAIDLEENCEEEYEFGNQLHDFTKKNLKVRFMDELNKTINITSTKEEINIETLQRRTVGEST